MERKWWTLIAVCVATFMLLVDVTIVNVALPAIQTSLKSSFSDLQWVIDAYSLMLAALLLVTGSLADRFGRRRVFVIGLCIFTVSSLLSGLATTPLFLNLARGAQGVGGAAMFSTSLALLANSFRGRERGVAFGVWGTITGLAVAIGPVAGGALTTGFGWRWIFLVNVPIGVIAVALSLFRVEESRQPGAHRPDWIGALTFSGALAALVYALIKGNELGWESTEILACLGGAAGLLVLFLIAELVQRAPMFDLALFRKPTFTGGSLVAFSLSAGMFSLLLYVTLYLQDVLGFSALDAGLRLLVLSGGILLTSTIAGRLTSRVPISLLIGPGLGMVGGGLLLMRGLTPTSDWQHFVPGFILAGAGVGLINPPLASTAVGVVEPARAGMASGINSTFRQVGIATGIAGFGAIFTHTVSTKIVDLLEFAGGIQPAQAEAFASSVAHGTGTAAAIASAPPGLHAVAVDAIRTGYVEGLNQIFLLAAIGVFATALLAFVLIRQKDFEASAAHLGAAGPADAPGPAGVADPNAPGPAGVADPNAPGPAGAAVVEEPDRRQTAPSLAAIVEPGHAGPQPAIAAWPAFRDTRDEESAMPVEASGEADVEDVPVGAREADAMLPAAEAEAETGAGALPDAVTATGTRAWYPPDASAEVPVAPEAAVASPEPEADAPAAAGAAAAAAAGAAAGAADLGSHEASDAELGPVEAPTVVGALRWRDPARAEAEPAAAAPWSEAGGVEAEPAAAAAGSESTGAEAVFEEQASGGAAEPWSEPWGQPTPAPAERAAAENPVGERWTGAPGRPVPALVAGSVGGRTSRLGEHEDKLRGAAASLLPDLSGPSKAVVWAAEQALADCASRIERIGAQRREADLGRGPDTGGLVSAAERDRIVALRERLAGLGEQHEVLVRALQLHTNAVNEGRRAALERIQAAGTHAEHAAQTRHELYGLIAALAALTDEAVGTGGSGAGGGEPQPGANGEASGINGGRGVSAAETRLTD